MRVSNKPHVDQAKHDRQRPAALARGGKQHMFEEQSAGRTKPGQTGKVQAPAPGSKVAKGGVVTSKPRSAKPATSGRTAPPR